MNYTSIVVKDLSEPERIENFLSRYYPRYKVIVMIRCGAIGLIHKGFHDIGIRNDTPVRNGNVVTIVTPLPVLCQRDLEAIPATEYLDYAKAGFGEDSFTVNMNKLLKLRPNTIAFDIRTLSEFIEYVNAGTKMTRPIRNLFIVSHANREGIMKIHLDPSTDLLKTNIEYVDLVRAHDKGILKINDEALDPRPNEGGARTLPYFIIDGCNIGQDTALPYLKMLKTALGGKIKVVAPKHGLVAWNPENEIHIKGMLGYGEYEFIVEVPEQIKETISGRRKLIESFKNKKYTYFNNVPIPDTKWGEWIPGEEFINLNEYNKFRIKHILIDTKQNVRQEITLIPKFLHEKLNLFKVPRTMTDVNNDTLGERKNAVREYLINNVLGFRESYPYIEWIRKGYDTLEEFINSWNYYDFEVKNGKKIMLLKYDKDKKTLEGNLTKHKYSVLRPIVDENNNLFCNFYPHPGQQIQEPIIRLRIDNEYFFTTI